MAKGRKSNAGYQPRRVDVRDVRQRFLIFCEGAKTEPAYFDSFRVRGVVVDTEPGSSDPLRLVNEAYDKQQRNPRDYDQVWCVFDRDDTPADRFNRALEVARQHAIHVAYSNQAFELWFLLHFQECGGALSRQEYIQRLNRHLERPYRKNDPRLHTLLEVRLEEALDRAARLMARYDPCCPADDDPSTTVHELVRELLRFSRP